MAAHSPGLTLARGVDRAARRARSGAARQQPQAVAEGGTSPPEWIAPVVAAVLAATFVAIAVPVLGSLTHDFDEACLMLDARFMLRGLRPFVDFAHHEMPLQLYLLALCGKVFGQSVFGYRMLSLLSVAGSGYLVFLLTRPVVGPMAALVGEAFFLFSPVQSRALGAVPETPALFFSLLGAVLLFTRPGRRATHAAGAAFVAALLTKPTTIVVVVAAVLSLMYAREWRRVRDLAVSGIVATVTGVGVLIYLSDGVFGDILIGEVFRVATRSGGMWSVDSGFADIRQLSGVEKPWQWALVSFGGFYQSTTTLVLFLGSLVGFPIWVLHGARSRPTLQAFVVLWAVLYVLLNFVVLDFVSARYFLPFHAFSACLVAGGVGLALRFLPSVVAIVVAAVLCVVLAGYLATTLGADRDPWYWGRTAWIAQTYPSVLSFSPMLFAATGAEPACDFSNPAITYGGYGEAVLVSERTRRFRFSDQRIIDCLRANPQTRVVIDWAFYFFTRPGSALRTYLAGDGREQAVFFSPDAVAQWGEPLLRISPLR